MVQILSQNLKEGYKTDGEKARGSLSEHGKGHAHKLRGDTKLCASASHLLLCDLV